MSRQHAVYSRWAVGLLVAGFLLTASAQGQELTKQVGSLKLVPANAGSYHVMLRNREQIDILLKSNAVARLMKLPFAQKAREDFDREWANPGGPFAPFKDWYDQKPNKALVEILKDLVSDEVFFYADRNASEFLTFIGQTYQAGSMAPLSKLIKDGPLALAAGANDPKLQVRAMVQHLAKNPEKIRFPDVVMGFKLTKTKPAVVAKLIDNAIDAVLKNAPPPVQGIVADRVKKSKINGADVHSLMLDGSLVPWDQVPFNEIEDVAGEFDGLKKRLKALKITFAVSVRENFLLLSLGEGTAGLKNLGGSAKRLYERDELAPAAKFADERIVAINYVSKESRSAGKEEIDASLQWVEQIIKDSKLTDAQKAKIKKDIKALQADVKKRIPEIGAEMSFEFLTKRGYEGYAYDWTKHQNLDSSKPLTILDHVGGKPIAFLASRSSDQSEGYDDFVKWVKVAYQYVEEYVVPLIPEEGKEKYQKFMKQALPLFARLDKTTGKKFLPSLDGQGAFVLDARLKIKLPPEAPVKTPMPVPEPAIVIGLKDAELFREAMAEYRAIFNDFAGVITKMAAEGRDVPDIKIPLPKTKKTKNGTLYYWPLDVPGLDKKVMPTGGISKDFAVLAGSHEHANRLLAKIPFKTDGGPLAKRKNIAIAAHLNWAGLIDAAMPWVDMALTESRQPNDVVETVQVVADVLKCFRGFSSATYIEGGATVTHAEAVFRDLEK